MLTFDEFLNERLKDPEFKKEWDALEPEREETLRQLRAEREGENIKVSAMQIEEMVESARA